jgi:hypothetical protein
MATLQFFEDTGDGFNLIEYFLAGSAVEAGAI